jgi:hypothetical protein
LEQEEADKASRWNGKTVQKYLQNWYKQIFGGLFK